MLYKYECYYTLAFGSLWWLCYPTHTHIHSYVTDWRMMTRLVVLIIGGAAFASYLLNTHLGRLCTSVCVWRICCECVNSAGIYTTFAQRSVFAETLSRQGQRYQTPSRAAFIYNQPFTTLIYSLCKRTAENRNNNKHTRISYSGISLYIYYLQPSSIRNRANHHRSVVIILHHHHQQLYSSVQQKKKIIDPVQPWSYRSAIACTSSNRTHPHTHIHQFTTQRHAHTHFLFVFLTYTKKQEKEVSSQVLSKLPRRYTYNQVAAAYLFLPNN